jgi:lysophospholipase L1-like esterase
LAASPSSNALTRVCWLVAPTVLVLLACELLLGALGLGEAKQQVSRGFSRDVAYLVPDPAAPGAFRTQMFQGEEPEIDIPRKSGARRVVLFGGSNTARFPGGNLQQFLNAISPAPPDGWEVVNLGRSGYGSARVALLFEQAFAIEPDLVVIYSGHNEFVELGFEMQIAREWNALERPLAEFAARLRTFHVLVEAWEDDAPKPAAGHALVKPERSSFEHDKFRGFQYAQTLERLRAYEANLDRMCELAAERGVPVMLGTLFSNDLTPPFVSNIDPALGPQARTEAAERLMRVQAAWPPRWQPIFPRQPPEILSLGDWNFSDGSDGTGAPELRAAPASIASSAPRWPLWASPSQWRPRTLALMNAWSGFLRGANAEERAQLPAIVAELELIVARAPDHPLAHYLLGLCALASGDAARARDELAIAARGDRAPLKASGLSNEIVRRVAARHSNVALFDFDGIVRARTPDGIIGFELMEDHCHAHAATYVMLMRDLAAEIAKAWPMANAPSGARGGGD